MADEIYGSVADSKAYFDARGVTGWDDDGTDDATLAAVLLRATEFIDGRYVGMFPGIKVGMRAQIREWPRSAAYDRDYYPIPPDEIPVEVIHATYEAALREKQSPGTLTPDIDFSARRESVRVEGAVSVTYSSLPMRAEVYRKIITIVDQIISRVLTGQGNTSSLSGAARRV